MGFMPWFRILQYSSRIRLCGDSSIQSISPSTIFCASETVRGAEYLVPKPFSLLFFSKWITAWGSRL